MSTTNIGLFLDHKVVNLSTSSLFLPSEELLHLGDVCNVVLEFKAGSRTVESRAVVVIESTANGPHQRKGFGLRLDRLPAEDLAFIKDQVNALKPKAT